MDKGTALTSRDVYGAKAERKLKSLVFSSSAQINALGLDNTQSFSESLLTSGDVKDLAE